MAAGSAWTSTSTMGKRQSKYSGLSYFAQEVFAQKSPEALREQETSQPQALASSQNPVAGKTRKASQRDENHSISGPSAPKKRKIGLLGPGREKHDATGLVPYYTDASEVPEHLRKCAFD